MKKSELHQIIKEEIQRILTENTSTTTLRDLSLVDLEPLAEKDRDDLKVRLPLATNSVMVLIINNEISQSNLDYYKQELVQKLGDDILDAQVILNPSKPPAYRVAIDDEKFISSRKSSSQAMSSFMSGERAAGRTSGLD